MTKSILIAGLFLILFTPNCKSQNNDSEPFNFPETKMGDFTKIWFESINNYNKDLFVKNTTDREWDDFFDVLLDLSKRKKGITPILISYETSDFISIYAKENQGIWVKVNLGLNKNNQITAMGIKKSKEPIDYKLRTKLNKTHINSIVKGVSSLLKSKYVIVASRIKFSRTLINNLNNGKYNNITQGDLLAYKLTKDLRAISNDKHLQIIPPSLISEVKSRFGDTDDNQNLKSKEDHSSSEEEIAVSSKKLENNIGLISFDRFDSNKKTKAITHQILTSFKNCKSIIIDLRQSGGGDAKAVTDLISYFFEKPTVITKGEKLDNKIISEEITIPNNLSKVFLQTPLYILTSSKTISAGESFTYFMKNKKRASIIGEKTAGAGFRVNVFDLTNGFYFVNSTDTSFDLDKNEGWDKKGITPDIVTKSKNALNKALSLIE